MEGNRLGLPLAAFACLLLLCFAGSVSAYKNYTVGDSLGWYDKSEKPVDYQKWAAGKNFSLGDFLIFNTNNNHSVVQTYNLTTYKLCDYDNSNDNDNITIEWSTADPSNTATSPLTVAVPLLKEGTTYFFSGDYDGDQCRDGQHFQINVAHGKGLPDALKDPADQAPAPNASDYDSTPDTVVPYDFSNPRNGTDDDTDHVKEDSGSISLLHMKFLDMKLHGILFLLGIACMF
ncbi:hypothetical protein Tsubulata_008849 [Turnera subulata]|uniref:Phytocyanin domain-containing protein n=1 Tax=Turnera subulata TaxID=218843 RepID=A0A9Q0F389_9ROSI|nr:hypothetical protein Tsubulata_008849 [Turnera subulata]